MTDIKKILKGELDRIAGMLPSLDPTTDEYGKAVLHFGDVMWKLNCFKPETTPAESDDTGFASAPKLVVAYDPKPAAPAPVEPEPADTTDWGAYRVALRERLSEGKLKGVNISTLLGNLGVAKFSSVPDSELTELSDMLDAALKELG